MFPPSNVVSGLACVRIVGRRLFLMARKLSNNFVYVEFFGNGRFIDSNCKRILRIACFEAVKVASFKKDF